MRYLCNSNSSLSSGLIHKLLEDNNHKGQLNISNSNRPQTHPSSQLQIRLNPQTLLEVIPYQVTKFNHLLPSATPNEKSLPTMMTLDVIVRKQDPRKNINLTLNRDLSHHP